VLDMAGFEKDSAGYYRAWWRADGAASVFASPRDWTLPVPVGASIPLFAFTAAPFAEAIVNGVSQGRANVSAYGFAAWPPVPFAPGSFVVRAFDASGTAVAEETIATAGAPTALRLQVETIGARPLAADGADVALVSAAVVDAAGAVVPGAAHEITWAVSGEGRLYGLANGKSNDLTPDKVGHPDLPYGGVWRRGAYMGRARAVVMTTTTAGAIHLSASAPGLQTGNVTFLSQ
jgi:beta-galactosidase